MQKRLFHERFSNKIPDTLIILQHPPVYTFGRRTINDQLSFDEDTRSDISSYRVDRGGGATYHGPGQVIAYPIFGLRSYTQDYYTYLRMLEDVTINTLRDFGISAERVKDYTGVWVDGKKIVSIGVRIIRGITMHGLSLNVNNDLTPFKKIIPCNIHGVEMTSMSEIASSTLSMQEVEMGLVTNFAKVFDLDIGNDVKYTS
ncbi:MAG TPA: lipoyl(octanoyl) transferase LipB [Nitrospirota bacterium]|nr:lipoyl(octanoyl) transferase LipB [Nitrospirota bacterium]